MVAFPSEPFAMCSDAMNSQDDNVSDDAWPSDDFEFMKMMECKVIGKQKAQQNGKTKETCAFSSKDALSPVQQIEQQQTFFTTADGGVQPCGLPLRLGHAALSVMTMMLHAQRDQRDTWKIFCAPESWLTQACEVDGLKARRINLACGYNLYDPKKLSTAARTFSP